MCAGYGGAAPVEGVGENAAVERSRNQSIVAEGETSPSLQNKLFTRDFSTQLFLEVVQAGKSPHQKMKIIVNFKVLNMVYN